ncbi:MAG: Smr/MutS family protein [Candidatus Marinimicrobia bacterium]|nr:Smr/MutS family protein [Candidatus Neomarinimicrobiota bacterium]
MSARFQIIDIGHQGFSLDRALSVLETTVSECVFGGKTRAIKVIHGHGTGALKRGIREWCADQSGRFQAVIFGENYDLFDPNSAGMRADCGSPYDLDLGRQNGAVTYIWL